jgi:hypothetical protein
MSKKAAASDDVLGWSAKQGYILVGGGLLNERQKPERDFDEEELPHYLLRNGLCLEFFTQWRRQGFLGGITGAWNRPLFSGGWKESTDKDTLAFNLQSPSLFVDLRFPVDRPRHLSLRNSLADCSFEDLRYLARQHCFSGYSLPSEDGSVYTRHHMIDWNYHPSFPRARPNKWRAEMNTDDHMSFKEWSTTLDVNQIPVYMERWQRFNGDSMGDKHFAAMRKRKLPGSSQDPPSPAALRHAALVLVGDQFCYALDRPCIPDFSGAPGPGGPALIDFAASTGDRCSAEAYLSLEGSYGHTNCQPQQHGAPWIIDKSTHPWREGKSLFGAEGRDAVTLSCAPLGQTTLTLSDVPEAASLSLHWGCYEWSVFENSYTLAELRNLFGASCYVCPDRGQPRSIKSRL